MKGTPRATPSGCRPACSVFQGIGVEDADTEVVDAVPEVQDTVQVIPGSRLLWRINTRPPNSAQVSASPLPALPTPCAHQLLPQSSVPEQTEDPPSLIRLSSQCEPPRTSCPAEPPPAPTSPHSPSYTAMLSLHESWWHVDTELTRMSAHITVSQWPPILLGRGASGHMVCPGKSIQPHLTQRGFQSGLQGLFSQRVNLNASVHFDIYF